MIKLSKLASDFLKKNQSKIDSAGVFIHWREAVGDKIASFSKPVSLKNGFLVVEVKESSWLMHLQYHQPKIIEKLLKTSPTLKLEKIYFKVNPNLSITNFKKRVDENLLYNKKIKKSTFSKQELNIDFGDTFKSDEEMRERFRRFKEACLMAQAMKKEKEKVAKLDSLRLRRKKNNEEENPRAQQVNRLDKWQAPFPSEVIQSDFLSKEDEFQPFDLY